MKTTATMIAGANIIAAITLSIKASGQGREGGSFSVYGWIKAISRGERRGEIVIRLACVHTIAESARALAGARTSFLSETRRLSRNLVSLFAINAARRLITRGESAARDKRITSERSRGSRSADRRKQSARQ